MFFQLIDEQDVKSDRDCGNKSHIRRQGIYLSVLHACMQLLGETVVRQRLGDRKDPDFCALFTDINLASQPLIG
jgi:hypothetical protein